MYKWKSRGARLSKFDLKYPEKSKLDRYVSEALLKSPVRIELKKILYL